MPLSKPAPRNHMHTREIKCRGYEREDGLWDIECRMTDTKTYSFENHDRDGINAGEAIHDMSIRVTLDNDLKIHAAEAHTDSSPFTICGEITGAFDQLNGLVIGPGWRKAVGERLGKTCGCTHLNDMLIGPLAVTAYQTIRARDPERVRHEDRVAGKVQTQKPAVLDTCHALASDGPIVKREWPEFYSGE